MKDLPAIARYMRLPEEQLRFPVELLNQGYEPNYLATYRPDELGGVDVQTLAKLKRAVEYEGKLAAHKLRVQQGLERDQHWTDTVGKVIAECTSISQTDSIARYLRGKRSAKSFADTHPNVEKLGQAILVMQSDAPKDFPAWVVEQIGCTPEQVDELVAQTKHWMQLLMCEDAQLILQLQRAVLRNANVSVQILPEPSKASDSATEASGVDAPPVPAASDAPSTVEPVAEHVPEVVPDASADHHPSPAAQETAASHDSPAESAPNEVAAPQSDAVVAPLIEQFHQGRKQNKGLKTKSLSEKQLSPRQRRRRWLRSIVESYAKLKKPLRALTPYQVLMFSRGIRSQIMQMQFHQDLRPLVQACRDSLCPGRHPMHPLLMEVAEGGLKEIILPRLHQDVLAIFEEDANQELIEAAVLHLQSSLLQRPVRGHRILLIDAVGQKTAAVAIVDASGNVLATGELPCNSSKPDVVAQNVTTLGQWVHSHNVTLIALSNGHARRYLIHSVAELMKQSAEGSLYWTILDRAGADAFCLTRTSLVELPRISRRHRSAVWLAWKLQDPLRQILKVEPARLRLGSYQRELPQQELETALHEAISAAITKAGVDVLSAEVDVLKRIPGMTDAAAKRLATDRQAGNITNRESLMRSLRETLSENQARQAIGFLRVYGSENTLDGTIIHPEDYRLAQRLIAHAELPAPPATPEGWTKPDYEKIAAAHAAVASMALESTLSEEVDAYGFEANAVEINPNFGVLDAPTAEDSEVHRDTAAASELNDASAPTSPETDAPSEEPASETISHEQIAAVADESAALDAAVSDEPSSSDEASATSTAESRPSHRIPEVTFEPLSKPALKVDAEKLARSWQVGRAKLMSVAAALQFPFADSRDFQFPVPLQSKVPKLDTLPPGTMLQAFVIGVADFGVFVELGPDCSGLVHISRLAAEFVEDPHQFVQVGDVIPVWVVNVDEKRKRVALTAIAPGTEPRRDAAEGQRNDERDARSQRGPRSGEQRVGAGAGRPDDRNRSNNGGARGSGDGRSTNRGGPGAAATGRGAPGGGQGQRRSGPGMRGGPGTRGGNDNRNRRNQDSQETDAAPRRPVKIERPKPEKPITEAMQQGKEPLRSFGDLLQFIKQAKPTSGEETPNATSNANVQNPANLSTPNVDAPAQEQPSSDNPILPDGQEPA